MSKKRLSYDYSRKPVTVRLHPRLLERLRVAGAPLLGGYSRIIEDSILLCLPFYEFQSEQGNAIDSEYKKVFTSILQPDCLGECIFEACKEIVKRDKKPQGKRKP